MRLRNNIISLALALLAVVGASAQTKSVMEKRHQDIAAIASLTAKGDIDRLKTALATSLDHGMTVSEAKEVIVHTYAYCGFPRAIRGLQTLVAVLDERKARGISDNRGREASPITDKRSKYERGRDILESLITPKGETASSAKGEADKSSPHGGDKRGASQPAYAQLSPEIEVFLKEHLFCDLFERDVLTYQERELATAAVINALGKGVEPMLRSHIAVALNIGVKPETLQGVFSLIEEYIGKSEADAGREILEEVLKGKE